MHPCAYAPAAFIHRREHAHQRAPRQAAVALHAVHGEEDVAAGRVRVAAGHHALDVGHHDAHVVGRARLQVGRPAVQRGMSAWNSKMNLREAAAMRGRDDKGLIVSLLG